MATFLERYQDLGAITDIGADTLFAVTKGADSANPPPVAGVARADALLAYMSANFQVTVASVNGLQTALDGKANSVHTHDISEITGTVAFTQGEKDKLAAVLTGAALEALIDARIAASGGPPAQPTANIGDALGSEEELSAFLSSATMGPFQADFTRDWSLT